MIVISTGSKLCVETTWGKKYSKKISYEWTLIVVKSTTIKKVLMFIKKVFQNDIVGLEFLRCRFGTRLLFRPFKVKYYSLISNL